MTVTEGNKVSLEYTLKVEDGSVVDTNVGEEPLDYVHGSRQIIPGLEKELVGMKVGESKQVTVPAEEGYGLPDPAAILEVPKDQVPADSRTAGAQVQGQGAGGRTVRARVVEVREESVLLDFNHPLAGQTLYFQVKVLDIQPQPAP